MLTNGGKTQNIWSVQPTIMIHYPEKDQSVIPEGVTLSQRGIISAPDGLTITINIPGRWGYGKVDNVIDEKSGGLPFIISPHVSLKGQWTSENTFLAELTSLRMNTLYTARTKDDVLRHLNVYSGGGNSGERAERRVKEFSFQTTTGWEEQSRFVIPVELEMPEEVLYAVKKVRVSLLIENLELSENERVETKMSTKKDERIEKEKRQQLDAWGFYAEVITPENQEKYGLKNVNTLHALVITSLDSTNHEYKYLYDNEDAKLKIGDLLTSVNTKEIEVSEGKSASEIILSCILSLIDVRGYGETGPLWLRLKRKDNDTNEYKEIDVLSKFIFEDNDVLSKFIFDDKNLPK